MASTQILQYHKKSIERNCVHESSNHERISISKQYKVQSGIQSKGNIVANRKQFSEDISSSSISALSFSLASVFQFGSNKNVSNRNKLDIKAAATATAASAANIKTSSRESSKIIPCTQYERTKQTTTKGISQYLQLQKIQETSENITTSNNVCFDASTPQEKKEEFSQVCQTIWKTVPTYSPTSVWAQYQASQREQYMAVQTTDDGAQVLSWPKQQQQQQQQQKKGKQQEEHQNEQSQKTENTIQQQQQQQQQQHKEIWEMSIQATGIAVDSENNNKADSNTKSDIENDNSNSNKNKKRKEAKNMLQTHQPEEGISISTTITTSATQRKGANHKYNNNTEIIAHDDNVVAEHKTATSDICHCCCCRWWRWCNSSEGQCTKNKTNANAISTGIFILATDGEQYVHKCCQSHTNTNRLHTTAREADKTDTSASAGGCCNSTTTIPNTNASFINSKQQLQIQSRLSSNRAAAAKAITAEIQTTPVLSSHKKTHRIFSQGLTTTAATTTTTTTTTISSTTATQRKLFFTDKAATSDENHEYAAPKDIYDHQQQLSTSAYDGATDTSSPRYPAFAAFHKLYESSFDVLMDFQRCYRILFSLIILFNMLPLFCAVASNFDTTELSSTSKSNPHPWIPIVAYLETMPKPTKSSKCDQTFVSRIGGPQNGTFSAPLLHNHKNHSRQCLYTFLAGPGQRVEVVFTSFNLRGSPPDGSAVGELPICVHEYMDIYSEVQSSDPAELINSPFGGRYCGTIPPRRRISMYRAIAISFFTNKNVSMPDLFDGTYRFINASEYEIGIPIAGSPCSYTITPSMRANKTGALISPTYPGAYPKDMSCTYQFLGEANQRVRLEFRDFDLFFGGPHCPFDYVKVYDGPDNSSALIGTYCGQQRNLVLYSSESSLFVHFYTLPRTANTQNRGFKGIYEFSESFVKLDFIRENDGIHIRGSECDQKILSKKESTGFVLSPNYPYPYIPKTVCRYFIYGMQDAQHLERVRLEFSAFNIPKVEHKDKSEGNCTDGYLKIYLKGQETADAYDKFDHELCGNETQRVISDGPRLAMVFSSGELQGRGFKGKYTFETEYKIPGTAAPDGTCSFTYVSSSKKRGELNSPRYPSNYPSETNCSYLFLGEPNEQVTIVFDHFKIKADGNANATAGAYGSGACFEDWLEMYVVYRDNNDRFLGRYCGLTAPGPVESPRGAVGLRITLHTDQENVASGFKARYFFETAKSDAGDCGGNFSNEDSGIITSPNYPAGYKAPGKGMASMACNWIMTARPGYKLSINFEHFSIEGDPANRGCPAAVLRLWVNVDSDQPPLELCGEKPPIEQWHYISTGQTARISFTTSDKTVGAQGFRIVWTEIQDSGPGPPSIGLLCESTYHFQCEVGYCISDKLRCDGIKNCGPGDDSDELHCTTEAPEEGQGVLITIVLVGLFLICLLCILYLSKRKRRNRARQLGLHRNARYDSQTSATAGLSSSRRHLQAGGSISGSLHGINSGSLIIPPAPLPPTSVPPPPHICIGGIGVDMLMNGDDDEDELDDNDDDDDGQHEIFINDVRFDDETLENLNHLENV